MSRRGAGEGEGGKGRGEGDEGVDSWVVNIHYLSFYMEHNSLDVH